MTIGLAHGGTTIYTAPAPSREVLVGTKEGIVVLERDGKGGWREARRVLEDKHISAIVFEPKSHSIIVGAFHGGISASTDGGHTWEERTSGLTENDVYSLGVTTVDGRTRVFAGTEPAHLFYSDDLGGHWIELPNIRDVPSVSQWHFPGPPHIAHVKHINFDPSVPTTVYVSVEQGALLRSVDAGQTWEEIGGPNDDVHRTVIPPTNPKCIMVTGGDGIYATLDSGATWEHRTDAADDLIGGYPDQLVFDPKDPETMFIAGAHHQPDEWMRSSFAGARISRSRDGGRTWEVLGGGLPERLRANVEAMALERAGDALSLFAATTEGEVWASEDGGDSWSSIAAGMAPISKGVHYQLLPIS